MNFKKAFRLQAVAAIIFGCGLLTAGATEPIRTEIPARPEGATDLVGFAAPAIDTVRVGFVGLGMRGSEAVRRFTHVPGSKITAICDIEQSRVDKSAADLSKAGHPIPDTYGGKSDSWKGLCEDPDVDLVYIATDWKNHAPIAIYAMEHGKHVAIEVPAALNLDEIWALINTAESRRLHCMMLENCVYDFFEMNTLNMAQQGLFGELMHVEGSYIHNLADFWDAYWQNWRMDYNSKPEYFANGDHTMTMIRTEKGKTIHIQHDVVNPRPYTRMYQLTGTKGFANKYPSEGYAFEPEQLAPGTVPDHQNLNAHGYISDEQRRVLTEHYLHPIIREVGEVAKSVGGHGGMDYIMDYRLIYCLRNGLPLDMDVYDLAEWCALAPLSAISIENGSAPVEVPDFTRGAWNKVKGYRHAFTIDTK